MNLQKFYMGESFDAYEYFGAHLEDGGVVFRTMRLNTDWEAFGGRTKRVMRKTIPDVVPAFSGMLFSLQ